MKQGIITKVSGMLVVAKGMREAKMYEVAYISEQKLVGEVIQLNGDTASIQVYEETSGIGPGEPVYLSGETMFAELGPGLLESIYDGIQRPLPAIEKEVGAYITRGIQVPSLDRKKKWKLEPIAKVGSKVVTGDILGEVQETTVIKHRVMVPPGIAGTLEKLDGGDKTVEEIIAIVKDKDGKSHEITMMQRWPIREPRPIKEKLVPHEPLITGMRVTDTMFPVVKGGAGAIPGPFGSGKTVFNHSLTKYCNAEIIILVGCGERGNEMTDVLLEFPHLIDPNTGEPLMKRTVLIANTSNMPVAAREASVYTGITIAEYYRDMGYNVALMADSTSRWAEALREISGRLEEMPGEEGYPAYLGSRTAEFYERAGIVKTLASENRQGSLTVVGAVSPPGGDLSEPVTQNTLRVVKVFWSLDAQLAYRRHFPAINWLNSYSLYHENLVDYWKKEVAPDALDIKDLAMELLQEEAKLEEIVRLVGAEALSPKERLVLETAKMLREDFLFQNAFDDVDAFTPLKKQYLMLKAIITFYKTALPVVDKEEFDFQKLLDLPIYERIAKMRLIPSEKMEELEKLAKDIEQAIATLS